VAAYLQALPGAALGLPEAGRAPSRSSEAGARLYRRHCADCHGEQGEGVGLAYPALAANRAVRMVNVANLVQVVLRGGFAPATAGNPRPVGMPPFQMVLSDSEVAAVITHIRSAWGNQAAGVTELDVVRHRAGARR